MNLKENINAFNTRIAEKLGHSLHESLEKNKVEDGSIDYAYLRDYIFRVLTFYNSINFSSIYSRGKTDKIAEKEAEIEFETYVMQPDVWNSWKMMWEYQKPMHDKEWLKNVLKEENKE